MASTVARAEDVLAHVVAERRSAVAIEVDWDRRAAKPDDGVGGVVEAVGGDAVGEALPEEVEARAPRHIPVHGVDVVL